MDLSNRFFPAILSLALGGGLAATASAGEADAAVKTASVAVDAAQVGQPISKYVYGQFIEHLGRCIYGGIWAEMLQDRKFFLPIGDKESPWKAVGDAAAVTMDGDRPFVGRHTPKVTLSGKAPGGLFQEGLGLRKGMNYTGYVWLAGDPEVGPVSVRLIWGDGPEGRATVTVEKVTSKYTRVPLNFIAGADTDQARLEIVAPGKGVLKIGTLSLMPSDNVQGMRADTLERLKKLDAPVYRWPGGNFVSGYNWRDGVGPRDRRPPRKNPAWPGLEHNDFGLDEFMTFCRYLKTEPYIAVNSGLGEVESALAELQYANGGPGTPEGKHRAENGHPEPYGVKFWGIGNEMYGDWQLGHMPLEKYVEKHNRFAKALKTEDPSIMLVAVGAVGPWDEGMMRRCADRMDLISEHFYCNDKPDLIEHVNLIPQQVRRITEAHRGYRSNFPELKGKDIRIALDEWNYWYSEYLYGDLGSRYFQKDALGIAAGLHEIFRNSDLYFMANYAQTVNVIGAIKTNKTAAVTETTGLVLQLYRRHFGTLPLKTAVAPPYNAAAALSADKITLTLAVVNPTLDALRLPLKVTGATPAGGGSRWQIAGRPMDYNEPGKPSRVKIEESKVDDTNTLCVAPCSVTLFSLPLR
ncbi:MAG: hypothetical protein JXB10_12220 [Pirellulales bacterium]|nr:hypothetical protein [Pirellulales bacterium]